MCENRTLQETLDLWYEAPAVDDSDPHSRDAQGWERDALLLGNGHMGAIVYGGVGEEVLTMNEKTLWQGGPGSRKPGESGEEVYGNWQKAGEGFRKLREQIFMADNHEVDPETARNLLLGDPSSRLFREKFGAYQTLCDLRLTMDQGDRAESYIRGLSLDTATAVVDCRTLGIDYRREYFMNYPDNVFVGRFTAQQPGGLSFTLKLEGRQPEGFTVRAEENRLILRGRLPDSWLHNQEEGSVLQGNRMRYEAQVSLQTQGGRLLTGDGQLRVEQADTAVLLFTAGTEYVQDYSREYRGEDPHEAVTGRLLAAEKLGYEKLKDRHLRDYCPIFQRVSLDLGQKRPDRSTAELVDHYADASEAEKRWLEALIFRMGRYLLLASSRAGSLPANLQGLWNPMIAPIWESDYHININLEMNYWMADLLAMPETLPPLVDWIRDLQKAGTVTAQVIYGFRDGCWVTHNPVNPLGHTGLQFYGPGLWYPEGSAWLLHHLIDHYDFTGDRAFLREIYPILQGNVKFWLRYLVEDPLDPGTLICCPTCLPEQPPYTMAASMSMQVSEELLRSFVRVSADLEDLTREDRELVDRVRETWNRMDKGLRIDEKEGIIRDWKYKPSRVGSDFRHFNQLYALYPGDAMSLAGEDREALMEAAGNFLSQRSPRGTPGWSRVWRSALWARIGSGEKAFEALASILDPETLGHNLLMRHPPFQIDANLGYPAAVAEMLLQSHAGVLHLLPALPDRWAEGSYTGFRARGGYTVSAVWEDHRLKTAGIRAEKTGTLKLRAPGLRTAEAFCSGKPVCLEQDGENCVRLELQAGDLLELCRTEA